MRKLTLAFITGAISFMPAIIKAQAFEEGKSQISVGYGLGNTTQSYMSAYDKASYPELQFSSLGPVFFKYEFGISEKVGFGLNVAYAEAGIDYSYGVEKASIKWWNTSFNARFNRHFGSNDKFDPYMGLGIGYKIGNWKLEGGNDTEERKAFIPLGFEATVGARYMFTPNIGLFSEVGLAKGIIQAGLNIKI